MSQTKQPGNESARLSDRILPSANPAPVGKGPVVNSDAERQFRHAALNLLEDAIRARSETIAINRALEIRIAEHEQSQTALKETQQQLQEAIGKFENLKREFEERVRERTKDFEQREQWLQESAAQIKGRELRERERLARLLHDQVQQLLVAAKIRVSLLAENLNLPENDGVGEVMSLLDEAVNATRDVSVQLAPPLLHDQGLPAAIEWLVSRTGQQFRLNVAARIDPSADPLSQEGRDVLFQAAQEFLLNAAKHARCKNVALRLAATSRSTVLTVRDDGRGFDVCRLHETGSFGLFEVQQRLQLMGGHIYIRSRPQNGTCSTAIVPTVFENGPASSECAPVDRQRTSDRQSIRVVLIDDHQLAREGLIEVLKKCPGILIAAQASDGEEGVQLVTDLHPDVVLMDINLPGINGIEATRQIKAKRPEVKVIGLSMDASTTTRQAFMDAGGSRYLTKDRRNRSRPVTAVFRVCRKAMVPVDHLGLLRRLV